MPQILLIAGSPPKVLLKQSQTAVDVGTYPTDEFLVTDHDTITNFARNPTIFSARSGDWSDAATWDLGRLPTDDDIVGIKTTHEVIYDVVSTDRIKAIGVAGKLIWDTTVDTELWVQTWITYEGGESRVGTAAAPIAANVTAEVVFLDEPLIDTGTNQRWSNGLIVFDGKLRVHGSAKTHCVRTTDAIAASATSLSFSSSQSGWLAGDRVMLPDTRHYHDDGEHPLRHEVRVLSTVGATSATIAALTYAHPAGKDRSGTVDLTPHVANLTRNVIFRSENPDGVRGHCIAVHRADVDVRYASFESLGRTLNASLPNTTTNQKGRYAWHFHHVYGPESIPASGYQFVLKGCVFEDLATVAPDMKWPITLHESSDGLVKENIVYKATGSGIMYEDGTEVYNVLDGNLICYVTGTGDRGDAGYTDGAPGREGNGLSIPNCTNYIRNNIVYDCPGSPLGLGCAYHLYQGNSNSGSGTEANTATIHIRAFQGADPGVNYTTSSNYPILEFADNECCCCDAGMIVWFIGSHYTTVSASIAQSVILRFSIWHTKIGFDHFPARNFLYQDCIGRGDFLDISRASVWFDGRDYLLRDTVFDGCDVQGFRGGIEIPVKVGSSSDVNSDDEDIFLIQNSILCNAFNIATETPNAVTGGGTALVPIKTEVRNCALHDVPSVTTKHLSLTFKALDDRPNINWIIGDSFYFYGCTVNGVSLPDARFWWLQQAGSFVTPQTSGNNIGSPDAGKTNTQNLADNGVGAIIGGAIAPTSTTRSGFDGYEEAL